MEKSELTQKVILFRKTGFNGKKLEHEIASRIYTSPILRRHLTAEQTSAFLCWFYPEILGLARRFRYRGKPFEAYINYVLLRRINSFMRRDLSKKEVQNIFEDGRFEPEIKSCDLRSGTAFREENSETEFFWLADAGKKRILYLFLREYSVSDPGKLSVVSGLTGYDDRWVQECGKRLRMMVYSRSKRYKAIKRRRNYTYYLLFRTERRLLKAITEEERKNLRKEITALKKSLITANTTLEKISRRPTHREIAEVTGNPKGSVDSGLFYLKKSFEASRGNEKRCA